MRLGRQKKGRAMAGAPLRRNALRGNSLGACRDAIGWRVAQIFARFHAAIGGRGAQEIERIVARMRLFVADALGDSVSRCVHLIVSKNLEKTMGVVARVRN